jgi:hypothetical protein
MADTSITFRRGNYEYGITLGWDEAQLSEGIIQFEVTVFRQELDGKGRKKGDPIQVTTNIIVEDDKDQGAILRIEIAEKEMFSLPLADLFDEDSVVGHALESVHSAVYGGDPVLGCLIRSGCSATVGQIISCKNDTTGVEWVRKRLMAIGRCLRSHIPNIAIKTALRAARCVFRLGF